METPSHSNTLITSLIFIAATAGLIVMTEISLAQAVPFMLAPAGLAWLLFRARKPEDMNSGARFSAQNVEKIRGEALTNITDALPRAIVGLNPNAEVIYANQAAFDMLERLY